MIYTFLILMNKKSNMYKLFLGRIIFVYIIHTIKTKTCCTAHFVNRNFLIYHFMKLQGYVLSVTIYHVILINQSYSSSPRTTLIGNKKSRWNEKDMQALFYKLWEILISEYYKCWLILEF